MKRVAPFLLLLAACGTPQEQCINRNTRDLRTVNQLIAESEGNLKRGYAIEEYTVTVPVWDWCYTSVAVAGPPGPDGTPGAPQIVRQPYRCMDTDTRTETRPKSIDLKAEAVKLDQLRQKQRQLSKQAESVVAQCKAAYPE